jgi:hypothetical protein
MNTMTTKNDNIRTMEFVDVDFWGNPVYKCLETEVLYKDLNMGKGTPSLYSCGNDFDGEPNSPINKELTIVFKTKYEESPYRHNYMMLSRLQTDVEYYLGYGNRYSGHLYYKDEKQHIEEMKKLHNSFPDGEKPEWLTWEQILHYEKLMIIE